MRYICAVAVLALFSFPLMAQNPGPVYPVTTAPSGACGANIMRLVGPGGTVYTCQSGTWAQISGGGGGSVTAVTATAPITSSGGTAPVISATYQGNGAKVQASTGTTTTNDCVKFDVNGNTVDAGAACATGTVTAVTATAPITSSGGATPVISATYQGNGAKVQASTGSTTTNNCVKFDANGNTVDAGAACGTGTSVKNLYSKNAAANIVGVGATSLQCNSNCPTPVAINSGSANTATLHVTAATTNQTAQDQFSVPPGFTNQTVTLELAYRSADSTHTTTITPTCIQVSTGDIANPTFAACGSAVVATASASSVRTVSTTTFTPSWTAGNEVFLKLAFDTNTSVMTSDFELISVRLYATF